MLTERSLYLRMAAILVALIGLINAAYLSITRLYPSALVCPTGGGCETVRASIYSIFPPGSDFGIPVAYLGVFGYGLLLVLGLISLQTNRVGPLPLMPLFIAVSSFGALFSIYLTAAQILWIGALCFWCVLSAACQWIIWITLIIDWRMQGSARSSQKPTQPVAGATQRAR